VLVGDSVISSSAVGSDGSICLGDVGGGTGGGMHNCFGLLKDCGDPVRFLMIFS